jgi:hypothetical protein
MPFLFWRRKAQQPAAKSDCCNGLTWTAVADFGHAAGVDIDLGRCSVCGSYLMCATYGASATYHRVSEERAAHYLSLQKEDPERLRLVLRKWVDS